MAYFAKIENNNVVEVIVADQEFIDKMPGTWLETFPNTRAGVHYNEDGTVSDDQSKAVRKNFAGIGCTYDPDKDYFIPMKPNDSWVLNESTAFWEAPVPKPDDGNEYKWDEDQVKWVLYTDN